MTARLKLLAILIGLLSSTNALANDLKLVRAAESKDWPLVEKLIREGAAVDQAQADGMTGLHWAAYHNDALTVGRLIEANCNVDAVTRYQITPLVIACKSGSAPIAKLLLQAKANANHRMPGGETLLMIAARTGNADTVRHLLEAGADPDARERRGQTALMWAAAEGNVEAVELLVDAGADLQAFLKSGFTAMMFAAREGKIGVVKSLLAAGVDVNATMKPTKKQNRIPRDGTSALTLAVESGHFELAMFLVKSGADPNDQRSGYTPLHAITWVRKPNRGEEPDGDPPPRGSGSLTSLDFVRAIVDSGADVNTRLKHGKGGKAVLNHKGATPFLLASKTADIRLMALLVELGADPNINNIDEATPLMAAAGVGVRAVGEEAGTEPEVIEAIDFLLDQGNNVNAVDKNKETAMHGAAYRNFPRVVEYLSKRGADPNAWNHKNEYGWTPVMIAQGNRPGSFKPSPETVAALEEAMNSESFVRANDEKTR